LDTLGLELREVDSITVQSMVYLKHCIKLSF